MLKYIFSRWKMSGKEDLRVKRTKKALNEAFVKLMNEKSFEDITINELCDEAGIRRATFYKHYTDKFDFLSAYIGALRDKFDNTVWRADISAPPKEYYVSYAKRLVCFIDDNATAMDNVMKSNMFATLLTVVIEKNYIDTCRRLNASAAAGMNLAAPVEVIASMAAGAVAAAIYVWLVGGKKKTAEQLADEIGAVVDYLFENKSETL